MHREDLGYHKLSLYSSYWMVNKTELTLEYQVCCITSVNTLLLTKCFRILSQRKEQFMIMIKRSCATHVINAIKKEKYDTKHEYYTISKDNNYVDAIQCYTKGQQAYRLVCSDIT